MLVHGNSSDEYTALLIIRDVEAGDAGKYSVDVKNEFGEFRGNIAIKFDPA